jgi:hypothetical protein
MAKLLSIIAAAFSVALTVPAFAGLIELTSRPATGDIVNWVQFNDPSGNPTPFATPANFTSTSGITGAAALANNGNGAIYGQGGNFFGNFGNGDFVFYTMQSGPLTLTFNTPLSTAGAQIDFNTYGAFTAEIQAFNQSTLLGTFTEDGTVTSNNDNSAIFLGVTDTDDDITSIVYSITWNAAQRPLTDFAINQVSIAAVPPPALVPEPTTWAMMLVGLGATMRMRRRKSSAGLPS